MAGVIGAVSQCRAAHSPLSHLSTSSGHCQSASSSNILRTACRRLTDFTSLRSCRSLAGFSQSSPQIYWGCVKSRGARIYEYSSNWIQKRGVILHISQLVDVVLCLIIGLLIYSHIVAIFVVQALPFLFVTTPLATHAAWSHNSVNDSSFMLHYSLKEKQFIVLLLLLLLSSSSSFYLNVEIIREISNLNKKQNLYNKIYWFITE